jgi:hypothetical protein
MCVLFYAQMASLSNVPSTVYGHAGEDATWLSQIAQFESVLSFYENSCFGLNMGAYELRVAMLSGPAIVVFVAALLAVGAKRLQLKYSLALKQRNVTIRVRAGSVFMNSFLVLYSSITVIVFQLISCRNIKDDDSVVLSVVFIDGTHPCSGAAYNSLIFCAAVLFVLPFLFWALLKYNVFSVESKSYVCSAYTEKRYSWVAITLVYRFIMAVLHSSIREFPSVSAMVLSICSVCMLVLLVVMRPYRLKRVYFMDLLCYTCLIIRFMLESVAGASESLGVSVDINNFFYSTIHDAALASIVLQ